jgi:cytidylate kinase
MAVIAMTREIGSHGSDVAKGVAAQLGLEIINSEIVVPELAGSMGVEPGVVQRYLDGNASLFDRWQVDTRKLSRHTLDPVLNLARKGDVLIRGWGAAALFQGIRGVLCVRVCAPMAERVRVMTERVGMKDAEAQQEIDIGSGEMAAIRVVAVNGKIVLDGVTSAGGLAARAVKLVSQIEGVNDVENCIISVPSHGRPDF